MYIDWMFSVNRLKAGDRIRVGERLLPMAEADRHDSLLACIRRGLTQDRYVLDAEGERAATLRRGLFVEDAGTIDKEIDPQIASVYNVLVGHAQGNPARDPLVNVARRMQAALFPAGLGAIIRLPYVQQAAVVERMVDRLQNEFPEDVVALGLSAKVAHLAELSVAYRRAVNATTNERTYNDVREARELGHRLFLVTIATIISLYPDETNPEHVTRRAQYLKPVADELDQQRARQKARRRAKGGAAGEGEADDTADTGEADDVDAPGSDAGDGSDDTEA